MIPLWLRRLLNVWKADGVSPLWLKQQAQRDMSQGVDWQYINWNAMKSRLDDE